MPNSINMYIVYVGVVKKRLHLCFQQYCPEVDKTIHVILPFSFHFRVKLSITILDLISYQVSRIDIKWMEL